MGYGINMNIDFCCCVFIMCTTFFSLIFWIFLRTIIILSNLHTKLFCFAFKWKKNVCVHYSSMTERCYLYLYLYFCFHTSFLGNSLNNSLINIYQQFFSSSSSSSSSSSPLSSPFSSFKIFFCFVLFYRHKYRWFSIDFHIVLIKFSLSIDFKRIK